MPVLTDRRTCPHCSQTWDAPGYTSFMACPECRAFERRLPAFTVVELMLAAPTLTVEEAVSQAVVEARR